MANNKNIQRNKSNKKILVSLGILLTLLIVFFVVRTMSDGGETASAAENLVIPKSEITETVKFYPYKAGNTNMEVLAVKAPDGTIRTALNTCQVCYDSGRGYYKQQGESLVCQNCGNRFKTSQVEKIKGGCNPVPITEENKTDDGTNIEISKDFLQENKDLFGNWKK